MLISISKPGIINKYKEGIIDMAFPDGWNYYKEYSQPGTSDGEKTDYQVDITIEHLMGKMRSDFGDIRFTLTDETELSYHLVSYTASDEALFVVKIPTLPTTGTTIKVYYGNPDATTTSNPANVYLLYDNLSTDNFHNIGGATHSILNNQISVSGTEGIVYHSGVSLSGDFSFEFTQVSPTSGTFWMEPVILTDGAHSKSGYLHQTDGAYYGNGSDWNLIESIASIPRGSNIKFQRIGTSFKIIIDGVEKATFTHSTLTNGYIGFRSENNLTHVYKDIKVRKYTTNPPATGIFGEEIELILKKYFRAKLKIIEEIRKRFRSKLWVSPERVQFRGKLNIFKRSEARFRAKLRTKTLNPQYISVKEYFRAKIITQALEKERFRAKVRINSGETRVELMAKVVLKQSEFDIVNPEFEFRIGGERYDS